MGRLHWYASALYDFASDRVMPYDMIHSLLRARHLRNAIAGTHLYMSDPPNRADLIRLAKGDEKTFITGYSLVSLGIFVPTTWYWMRHRGTGMRIWNLRCVDPVPLSLASINR